MIPGHEIVGIVEAVGPDAERLRGVGVPWLGWACGVCEFCCIGRENLCDRARFTGYQIDGDYAEYAVADERFCFAILSEFGDREAAPLMCAGLIGYRALRMGSEARRLGLYGFGAAVQIALHRGQDVFTFTKPGDAKGQVFARPLDAAWAGNSETQPLEPLDAALIFAPVGVLVPATLVATTKGGVVVCAGIHMSDIPRFPYRRCGMSTSCARSPI